jgi:hypothetical protein
MIESSLMEWVIDSVFTITVNNASTNDVGIEYMRRKLNDKSSTVLGGEFLHIRYAGHILNLVINNHLNVVCCFCF